jgi:hypothetical protein
MASRRKDIPVKRMHRGFLGVLLSVVLAVVWKLAKELAAARAAEATARAAEAAARAEAEAARAVAAAASAPDTARRISMDAFNAAEEWRQARVLELYANMTDADWDSAARWKSYAKPDAPERSCAVGSGARPLLSDIALLSRAVAALPQLGNASRRFYLALHTYHSTGLEGNTLTLPETLLTVAGQPLFGGFDSRVMPTPLTARSVLEAQCLAQLWVALDLASLPGRHKPTLDLASLPVSGLVDLNSAITRGSNTPTGLRRHPVAIGHQRVLLPMPDEVPVLVDEYLAWLRAAVLHGDGAAGGEAGDSAALERQLTLACDAHTRFVFVHPFADGNGRLARTLAGLVLQRAGLPAPMFTREARAEYMAAVAAATMDRNYAPLAALHAAAVRRALACQIMLADGAPPTSNDGPLEDVLSRSGCFLHPTQKTS